MPKLETKDMEKPDDTLRFEKARVALATLGGATVGRAHLEPGGKWPTHFKPIAKTDSCLAPRFQYHISGVLHVKMDDGTQRDVGPGESSYIPPGRDAWVVGREPVVTIEFQGLADYAKGSKKA